MDTHDNNPRNECQPKVIFWFRTEFQDLHRLCLKRAAGKFIWVLLFAALIFLDAIGVACGFGISFALNNWHETNQGFWLIPVFSAGLLVPICMTFQFFREPSSELLTKVDFLLDDKVTVLTYLRFFRKRISALPSWIEISSQLSGGRHGTGGYTAGAALRFANRRTKIWLLRTPSRYHSNAADAERCAATAAAEIREALNITMDLPDKDAITAKVRWSFLFGVLLFAGFSVVAFYVAFQPGKYSVKGFEGTKLGRPILPDPHSWDQLLGRLIASGAGMAFAGLTVLCFWLMIGPSRMPTKSRADRVKFYLIAALGAFLWGAMGIHDCVLAIQTNDWQAFWMRLVILVGVPCGVAVANLVKAKKLNHGKATGDS